MSDLKIGFIGVGGVAQPHLDNLNAMEGVQISAVCDTFADRAKEIGEKFDASIYIDYKKMIETEKLDGVYVCVIPGVHGDTELDLAKARLPFYIEKPVHLDLDACQRVWMNSNAIPSSIRWVTIGATRRALRRPKSFSEARKSLSLMATGMAPSSVLRGGGR